MPKDKKPTRRRLDFSGNNRESTTAESYKKLKVAKHETNDVSSAVTPEAGSKSYVTRTKSKDLFAKEPKSARKLVTPLKDDLIEPVDLFGDKEDDDSVLYQSGDEEQDAKHYKPTHIHRNVDYHRRGELALDQRTLKAYRFIRHNFLIPSTFENDRKFGPLSGSCFEERVIRAYSLGQLAPRVATTESSLLVCTYCGKEGHMKESCADLL
ncbi:hypothetical protein HJC23_009149 [Cyclotella cryptica]|uniref:CCHC-type domain-containing protein n=1 Tax=Cyclotella cryptica TaxID=29204 RepID=A0ABD3NZY8_9STRA|eukprot:CCRYP_018454-RA/>CCRYP_018454-RA protein AED:0.10 eAED:-0.12 QI:0/-1/0/1/-1/1/1/0/209